MRTTLILAIIILASCSTSKNNVLNLQKLIDGTVPKNPLGFLYQLDTLTLTARFSECGEFGGHKEKFLVFTDFRKQYFVKYTKDSIDLDCPNDFEENAVIIQDTFFKINVKKEKLIEAYLGKLYTRAMTPKIISHANDYFNATTKHTGLSLYTAEPKRDWHEFRKLQIELLK